jgi:wobble nucleotide-excising tRNase
MGWQEEHERRVAAFPQDIRDAHKHSSGHRVEVQSSATCGCFSCCRRFEPSSINEWVDQDEKGTGQTALCPFCGIDSVIGDKSGFPITNKFLAEMNRYWF